MSVFKSKEFKEIRQWFLVNILAPVVVPWISVFALYLFYHIDIVRFGFENLWEGGVFAFLCLFAYLNLVPNFLEMPKSKRNDSFSSLSKLFGTALFIIGIFSILFFMSFLLKFLPISNNNEIKSFSENFYMFNIIMAVGVFFSIVFKVCIVRLRWKTIKPKTSRVNLRKIDNNIKEI